MYQHSNMLFRTLVFFVGLGLSFASPGTHDCGSEDYDTQADTISAFIKNMTPYYRKNIIANSGAAVGADVSVHVL
jgi:hypothetical protein